MRPIDYVYVTSYNECDEPLVVGLRDAFSRRRESFAVIGYVSTYVENLHRKLGVQFFNLREPGPLKEVDQSQMEALQVRLGTTLREFVFPERRYYMSREKKLLARTHAIVRGFERLRAHARPGCIIQKLGAEIVRRAAVAEARCLGIPNVFFGTFPAGFRGRTYLHRDLLSERDTPVAPKQNFDDELPYPEFREMLVRLRDKKEVISYPAIGGRTWREAIPFIRSLVVNQGEGEFLDDVARRKIEYARFHWRSFVSNRFAGSKLPEEPFYFFPLHVFDDSQITVRNPHFYDQFWIIEYIDRVIPDGMKLVVKLHPGLDGAVPMSFLSRLRTLKNVVLLRGSVNAHEVTKRSVGVIVINSTVAFEALLHRKPVLVLGNWAFGGVGITEHLDDFRDLPGKLLSLRNTIVDPDLIDQVLYNFYGEMYRCSYNRHPISYDAIAASIADYATRQRGESKSCR